MKIINILRNYLKRGFAEEMSRKIKRRLLRQTDDPRRAAESAAWCRSVAEDYDGFAQELDQALWSESQEFGRRLDEQSRATLQSLPVTLGGGGHSPLLYFFTRLMKPDVVVETGVAAGFSSVSFLEALRANQRGRLYSSDLPYFRLPNPEKYVGILVPDDLRASWTLYLEGDRRNLTRILDQIETIDLFHYDSDKSEAGRAETLARAESRFTARTVAVIDDIDDNLFFREYAERVGRPWRVFHYNGRYVGVVGL